MRRLLNSGPFRPQFQIFPLIFLVAGFMTKNRCLAEKGPITYDAALHVCLSLFFVLFFFFSLVEQLNLMRPSLLPNALIITHFQKKSFLPFMFLSQILLPVFSAACLPRSSVEPTSTRCHLSGERKLPCHFIYRRVFALTGLVSLLLSAS